jgi:hypothetical protein
MRAWLCGGIKILVAEGVMTADSVDLGGQHRAMIVTAVMLLPRYWCAAKAEQNGNFFESDAMRLRSPTACLIDNAPHKP